MAFTREQIRESIERAGDAHWQALIRHHEDAYPESRPTPGDVARAEAERLNALGLGDNPDVELVESRVEQVPPAVRITHVFEDHEKGTRFEADPRRALLVMTELQLDTVLLAPSGPNVDRARTWLAEAAEVLRSGG